MNRTEAIRILEINKPVMAKRMSTTARRYVEAFEMAIASLKTDEAYQLEYENRDFVEIPEGMTNGEVIQALFPNETMFEQTKTCTYYGNMRFDTEWWNAPYQKGGE